MKKIIIALGIALLLISCKASQLESYENNFGSYEISYTDTVPNGIFQLRLGMTEDELRAVVDTSLIYERGHFTEYPDVITYHKERLKKLHIREYVPTSGNKNTPLSEYKMKDIFVRFLDDKIYYIFFSVEGNSMKDILINKYGKPKDISYTTKEKRQRTKISPAHKTTTQYGDTYKTIEYPETSTVKEYTIKVKHEKYIWRRYDKDYECIFSASSDWTHTRFSLINVKTNSSIFFVSLEEKREAEKLHIPPKKVSNAEILDDL